MHEKQKSGGTELCEIKDTQLNFVYKFNKLRISVAVTNKQTSAEVSWSSRTCSHL